MHAVPSFIVLSVFHQCQIKTAELLPDPFKTSIIPAVAGVIHFSVRGNKSEAGKKRLVAGQQPTAEMLCRQHPDGQILINHNFRIPVFFADLFQRISPFLIISAIAETDHWDHLDYATATALRSKVGQVVCPLGVGAHFEAWGYGKETVFEGDWYSVLEGKDGFAIHILPARHFSGRSLTRNKTLWAGFALVTPERRIFFSGDSGYGKHFAEIGARFGGFDLAMLDCGQYDENWRYVHMMPEDTAQAAEDLRARALLPGHVGKFAIAYHTWDDPFKRIVAASRGKPYRLLLPLIGEPVALPIASDGEILRWWEAGR